MNKKLNRLIHLVNTLEKIIYEPLYSQKYVDNNKAWDYVSYSFGHFLSHIEEAHQIVGKTKFLDVGCGIGSKTHLAGLFFDSYGIELNSDYHKVAKDVNVPRKFFKYGRYKNLKKKNRIFKKDALEFDYSPYGVIYFFRPLNEPSLQKKLEQQIFETAKPMTIIIPIYAESTFPNYIRHLPTPSGEIYMKIKDDERAEKVHNKIKSLF